MSAATTPPRPLAALRQGWARIAPRERRLVLLAAATVALALLWALALSPALRTLRQAPAQRAILQDQAQRMQQLKTQAQSLQALPRQDADSARQALQAATQRLGHAAQLRMLGDNAQITLTHVPAQALADWLADTRANARALPLDARLRRSGDTAPGAPVFWSGAITLGLPAPEV